MVTIQQATLNALATWLSSQLSPAGVVVEPRFPNPSKALPNRAVTLVLAGPRRDEPIVQRLLNWTNVGTAQSSVRIQVRACEQPIQIDVWAKTDPERDDILARLDQALTAEFAPIPGLVNPLKFGSGLVVNLADGWTDTFADIRFGSAENTDTVDGPERSEYRSTIRGVAHVMLAVTRTTARQIAIKFSQQMDSDPSKDTWTITPTGVVHS